MECLTSRKPPPALFPSGTTPFPASIHPFLDLRECSLPLPAARQAQASPALLKPSLLGVSRLRHALLLLAHLLQLLLPAPPLLLAAAISLQLLARPCHFRPRPPPAPSAPLALGHLALALAAAPVQLLLLFLELLHALHPGLRLGMVVTLGKSLALSRPGSPSRTWDNPREGPHTDLHALDAGSRSP